MVTLEAVFGPRRTTVTLQDGERSRTVELHGGTPESTARDVITIAAANDVKSVTLGGECPDHVVALFEAAGLTAEPTTTSEDGDPKQNESRP